MHVAPRSVALTGVDCFLRALEHEVRRYHGGSHLAQLVLRLGPGFGLDAFRTLIADTARATPMLHAPVRRRFGVAPPAYRTDRTARIPLPSITVYDAPAPTVCRASGDTVLPEAFCRRLNLPMAIEHGELLHFDIVQYERGAHGIDLAVTWAHMLFDGHGSELFVRYLDDCFHGRRQLTDLHDLGDDHLPPRRQRLSDRLRLARKWQTQMVRFAASPPRSLGGPVGHRPQELEYTVDTLSRTDTATVVDRASAFAGFLTPALFYLAAAIRAHDAVFASRGVDPGNYLIPLPVNLRPKGTDGAVFRMNVSLLWFQVDRRHVRDLAELVAELVRQRRASIRDGMIESGSVAMDLMRAAPARIHTWIARRNFGGELASFYFAFTNEFLSPLKSFFGADILNGFHAPSVMPSPGSSAVLSIRDGRLNVTHIYQRDALTDEERLRLRHHLLADLLGCEHDAVVQAVRSSGSFPHDR